MQKIIDEHKNLKTETNQLKLINEKLVDRVELMNNIIEKEASAGTYYYNCPPKGDVLAEVDQGKKEQKKDKKDNEGNKVKKMYEDMMEQQRK